VAGQLNTNLNSGSSSQLLDDEPVTEKHDDTGESTEVIEYMQKLIARMNANPSGSAAGQRDEAAKKPATGTTTKDSSRSKTASTDTATAEQPREKKTFIWGTGKSKEVVRSPQQTQDSRDSLMRLREAANLTTKNALLSFSHKNLIRDAYKWYLCAIGAIVFTAVALTITQGENSMAKWTCRIGLLLSVVATGGYLRLVRRIPKQLSSV
jgi:hypothetical protein